MNLRLPAVLLACGVFLLACGTSMDTDKTPVQGAGDAVPTFKITTVREGSGAVAEPGQVVVVHYTGWLFDNEAAGHRGAKFDSSLDRGQHFKFPLGAGRVIKGWDQGVAGMHIGEVRELIIPPELGYGKRGAPGAIPPNATLVFEVELFGLE